MITVHYIPQKSLVARLIPLMLGGFIKVLDKRGQAYFILLCRLIDQADHTYLELVKVIAQEQKSGDRLANILEVTNHIENLINLLSRITKIYSRLVSSNKISNIQTYIDIDPRNLSELESKKVIDVRNRIEHIDEDIANIETNGPVSVSVDDTYTKVSILQQSISFEEIEFLLQQYHHIASSIFNAMPVRMSGGVFYFQDGRTTML